MRSRTIALAVAALAVTVPATASARPTASVDGSVIRIVDSAGLPDNVTITLSAGTNWRIQGVDGGSGCTAQPGGVAFCDDQGTRTFEIALAGGNDRLTYSGAIPVTTTDLGDGDDAVTSSAARGHTILGGAGNDTLTLTGFAPPGAAGEAMTLDGGGDNDVLDVAGRRSADTLGGGSGNDRVSYLDRAATAPVTVSFDAVGNDGGAGEGDNVNDDVEHVTATAGVDTLTGDAGDQTFDGAAGADVLAAGGGTDTLSFASRTAGVTAGLAAATTSDGDTISGFENATGGSGNDTLSGTDAVNALDGGPGGNDTLDGRLGADQLNGGGGTLKEDIASYDSRPGPVTASLDGVANDPDGDVYTTINGLRGTAAGDTLRGGPLADRLFGLGGDDVLDGGPGDLVNDRLDGGDGAHDRADYSGRLGERTLDIRLAEPGGEDSLGGIEDVTGSPFSDEIRGDGGPNRLDGAGGVDRLVGGLGADALTGGPGFDVAHYGDGRTAGVTASLDGVANDPDGDSYSEIEGLVGTPFGDTLLGGAVADSLNGSSGDDTLRGGGGPDTLEGGFGADLLDGGPGSDPDVMYGDTSFAGFNSQSDTVDYSARTTAVIANLTAGVSGTVTIDGDVLHGIPNVTGGSGNDRLVGTFAKNTLRGGPGIDRLDGKAGDDTLLGDAGNDVIGPLVAGSPTTCNATAGSFPVCTIREFVASPPPDGDDIVNGGEGNDLLSSVDGFADAAVNCGKGTDVAEIDLLDPSPSISCEQSANGARDQHPLVRFPSRTARLSKTRRLAVRMACPRARGRRTCKGTLTIRRGTRTVARKRYSIRRGRARTVRLRVKGKRPRTVTAIARGRDTKRRALTTRAKLRVVRRG